MTSNLLVWYIGIYSRSMTNLCWPWCIYFTVLSLRSGAKSIARCFLQKAVIWPKNACHWCSLWIWASFLRYLLTCFLIGHAYSLRRHTWGLQDDSCSQCRLFFVDRDNGSYFPCILPGSERPEKDRLLVKPAKNLAALRQLEGLQSSEHLLGPICSGLPCSFPTVVYTWTTSVENAR